MTQERRSTDQEILSKLDDLKDDLKEHKQDIKEVIDEKFKIHNQIYFNGFHPHEHIEDHNWIRSMDKKKIEANHRIIDTIVEDMQDDKKATKKMVHTWIDRGLWAAITFIASATWFQVRDNIIEVPTKPKTEQSQNANTTRHP